jgi:alpha/beta superfamily hydrolase
MNSRGREGREMQDRKLKRLIEKPAIHGLMRLAFGSVFGWKSRVQPPATAVSIPTKHGNAALEGFALNAGTEAKGVVLLCHPFLKYGMHYFLRTGIAEEMRGRGYHVVAFNFMGFGASKLAHLGFPEDVEAVVSWIGMQWPGQPVHLLGFSFGGYQGIHALPVVGSLLTSAVFDSVPPSFENFFKGRFGASLVEAVGRSRWRDATGTAPITLSLSKDNGVPVLLLFGDRDKYAPSEQQEMLRASQPHPVKVFPESGHLESYKRSPEEFYQTVCEFFRECAEDKGARN